MPTVAELRMDVDSRPVSRAKTELRDFQRAAERTDRAADKLERGFDKVGDEAQEMGQKTQRASRSMGGLESIAGKIATRVTAAAGAMAGFAVSAASIGAIRVSSAFESQFSKIETLLDEASFSAGTLEENIDNLEQGLVNLRSVSGDSFENLTKGLFDLISAGVDADDAIRVLNDANTLAKAGVTDVSVAVDGLTTALNAYQIEADKSEAISAKFFTTQKFGKTTVEELSRGLGRVAPLAAQLGVELNELLASQAAATSAGIRQEEAFTGLKAALTNIIRPTADAVREADRLGISFDAATLKAKGLTEFLKTIQDSAEFTDESFQNLFNSAEGLNFVLATTGGGAEVYARTLAELSDETKAVNTLNEAFARVMADADEQTKQFRGALDALFIEMATEGGVLEEFTGVVKSLTEALRTEEAKQFARDIGSTVSGAVGFLRDNWDAVATATKTALNFAIAYVGVSLATSIASVLNLANAWRAVSKAVQGAAASTALLGAASGATGLRGVIAGLGAMVATAGRAVFSLAGLRAAWLALSNVIRLHPIGALAVAVITAFLTFRKEIGQAIDSVKRFVAQGVAGTDKLETAFEAVVNVAADRLGPAIESVSEFINGIKTEAAQALKSAFEGVQSALRGIVSIADAAAQKLADLIPQEIIDAAAFLADRLEDLRKGLANLPAVRAVSDFAKDVRSEADRLESLPALRAAQEAQLAANDAANAFIGVAPGLSSELQGLAGEYDNVAHAVVGYTKAQDAANDNAIISKRLVGEIEQGLLKQLALAEKVEEAARTGGSSSVEFIREEAEIERIVDDLFRRAQEAGEDLTRAQIDSLIRQIDASERATQKLLEAEEKLLSGIARTRQSIADNLDQQIDSFVSDVQRFNFGDPRVDAASAFQAFNDRLESILADFEIESIGLDSESLAELEKKIQGIGPILDKAFVDGAAEIERAFQKSLQFTIGSALDDLLFNGGQGLGRIFNDLVRDTVGQGVIDPIAKFFSGQADGGLFENIGRSFKDMTEKFAKVGSDVAGSISSSLAGIGGAIGAALGGGLQGFGVGQGLSDLLGLGGGIGRRTLTGGLTGAGVGAAIGSIVPGIGTAIGAAVGAGLGALAGAISSLFGGKKSDNTAQGVFRPDTGEILGLAQDKKAADENAKVRDALISSITDITKNIASLIGTQSFNILETATNEALINIAVRQDRKTREQFIELGLQGVGKIADPQRFAATPEGIQAALEAAVRLAIENFRFGKEGEGFQPGGKALLEFAQAAAAADRPVEEIISVLGVLKDALDSGKETLAEYAAAAAKAGLSGDEIVAGINSLEKALTLGAKPLSKVEQGFKDIDAAIDPAIESLKAVGQSFAEIAAIGEEAASRLGKAFIDEVRDLNLQLSNETLFNFKTVLDEIAQRQTDAFTLLQRGAITQSEFDFVQSTGGLQASRFFETLPEGERDNLASFLGLLGEASGDIAVARAELEEQFRFLIDNVEETVRGFEDAARNFERLAEGLRATEDRIRTQFGTQTPRDTVTELLGRLAGLRNDALEGNQSALQALPQVVTSLVDAARQAFGGTAEFARIRDIGLAALDETATVAETLAKQNFEAAEAARKDVDILEEIRVLLGDERQLQTLQDILDQGKLSNDLIAQQLQAFLNLFGQGARPGTEITAEQLRAAAEQRLLELQRDSGAATRSASDAKTTTSLSADGTTGSVLTDAQIAQIVADNTAANERLSSEFSDMSGVLDELVDELRRERIAKVS